MIRLHDTLARAKRDFVPGEDGRVTMYVCGPTVYGRAHIGNARPAVVFDTLRRLLEHQFPDREVIYARNVTDVDDKIIAVAEAEGVAYREVTERYYRFYMEDMGALNVQPPTFEPRATAFIPNMIAMIERLIVLGHAYEAEGHVLFSVPSDPDYGALSRRDRNAMIAGARVEVAPYKRDPADFVLWKPSGESAESVALSFKSPWGPGRPGWHIECSAMIEAFASRNDAGNVQTIDIHGGGLDLIFPHHENEIAQSRCAHDGAPLARYWVHNGFVDMGAEKMSKSLGNVVTVDRLLAEGHRGETLRAALLSAQYRSPLPWTEELVQSTKARLDRWNFAVWVTSARIFRVKPAAQVVEALSDDLNTPKALSALDEIASEILKLRTELDGCAFESHWEKVRLIRKRMQYLARLLVSSGKSLGLFSSSARAWTTGRGLRVHGKSASLKLTGPQIELKLQARARAKNERNFTESDRIRDELKAEGILLVDGPEGTTWRRA